MITAGRTLRLVKSLKGIGGRITSPIEKLIEDVVRGIVPSPEQPLFRLLQPGVSLRVAQTGRLTLYRDQHIAFLRQIKTLAQRENAVFVDRFDGCGHKEKLRIGAGNGKLGWSLALPWHPGG